MMSPPEVNDAARGAMAPLGHLRASINLGNPILAYRHPETGQACGVSVDLAQGLADLLAVPLELVVVDSARQSVENTSKEIADVGFVAIDPLRAATLRFTPPYVLIEGTYLVRDASPIQALGDVDRDGISVVVGAGSAYDLYLSRELGRAAIVRAATSPAVVDTFLAGGHEVAAGVRQQLEADAQRLGGLRVLPGNFMQIAQAMAVPHPRGAVAADFLGEYVQWQKQRGFVAESLRRHQVPGAAVAPMDWKA